MCMPGKAKKVNNEYSVSNLSYIGKEKNFCKVDAASVGHRAPGAADPRQKRKMAKIT